MASLSEKWRGYNPAIYAQETVKSCGLKEPPFCENTIADALGLKIFNITDDAIDVFKQNFPNHDEIDRIFRDASTFLYRDSESGKKVIFTPESVSPERRRMNIFHECGHDVVPWHEQYCYICHDNDLSPLVHKQLEQEAFHCGSEFLMPRAHFIEDLRSIDAGIPAIQLLAKRYHASLEATAIHYAKCHPGICSILMIETAPILEETFSTVRYFDPTQSLLRVGMPYGAIIKKVSDKAPLRVKYSLSSKRFPDYIKTGTPICENNLIYKCWESNSSEYGEIPAITFGFLDKPNYTAECLPLGYRNRVLVLLKEPDYQKLFNLGVPF